MGQSQIGEVLTRVSGLPPTSQLQTPWMLTEAICKGLGAPIGSS